MWCIACGNMPVVGHFDRCRECSQAPFSVEQEAIIENFEKKCAAAGCDDNGHKCFD